MIGWPCGIQATVDVVLPTEAPIVYSFSYCGRPLHKFYAVVAFALYLFLIFCVIRIDLAALAASIGCALFRFVAAHRFL